MTVVRALSRYARTRGAPVTRAGEVCELCAVAIAEGHGHVVDLKVRQLACVCRPCALLFTERGAANGRYRTVPDRVLIDPGLVLDDETWSTLDIPVRLAFVFFNSSMERWVAFYPSPAGPTESELSLEAWTDLSERSPLLQAIEPDVEALLVYGTRSHDPLQAFLVPIDTCYELVALVRTQWKGFDGGDARQEIAAFFERLRQRARRLPAGGGAR